MNQYLFCLIAIFLQLISFKRSNFSRLLLFPILFFFSGFSFGQIKTDSVQSHPVISVKNGAAIYSLDESFNEQILKSNMVKDGKTTVAKNGNNRETVIIESTPRKTKDTNSAKSFVDSTKSKIEQESLKKVKKHLEVIQKNQKKEVYITPLSSEKSWVTSISMEYLTISVNHNDHKEFGYAQAYIEIIKRLNFLESRKISSYNSQSLGYTVISHLKVRPPPAA